MIIQDETNHKFTFSAWLFDVYPSEQGITIWLIDQEGNKICCFYKFKPSFFLHLNSNDIKRVTMLATQYPTEISIFKTSRMELYSGKFLDVIQVLIHNPLRFKNIVQFFEKFFAYFAFFNSDISVEQQFLYETRLFPLARGEYKISSNGELIEWQLNDSREATEYEIPPLSIMQIRISPEYAWVPPKYQKSIQLEISYDNRTYVLEQNLPNEFLEAFNWHLYRCNPDLIITDYGDSIILPKIAQLSKQLNIPLLLNRDPKAFYCTKKESSFFQYGRIVHKDGAFLLAGRWHIDTNNSFTIAEADLDGLFEMVRLTQMCGQQQARASIGTSMSSMQFSWAYQNKVLIPSKKREAEEFKSAETLLLADRGGLIFNPPAGYHEEIAELDFVSMYPTIMVNNNISPETINCQCCASNPSCRTVPELGYRICSKRKGLIPETLRNVIIKRAYYKQKKKEYKWKDPTLFKKYDRLQNALKWMLVSCFGYLGYKNARFGRIEAHESVNAFSREAILMAKEIAERNGFEFLHAIIDCMWLKKPGATQRDYELLSEEIARRVGIDISLEGIYNWILFPSLKTDPGLSANNHYVGCYKHGDLKMRGIEARRHDVPKIIKNMQKAMLEKMATARNVEELSALLPEVLETARNYISIIRSGRANSMELVIKRHITKEPEEYTNNSISAIVSKMIEEAGIHLSAGESIEFIIIDQSGKKNPEKAKPLALYALDDGYDIEQYTEFALKAIETLLLPFGYDIGKIKAYFGISPTNLKSAILPVQKQVMPLFQIEI